jgi:hypothetical protein
MDDPPPTKKKKTKSFLCPLCKLNYYTSRSLSNHILKCRTSNEQTRSIHIPEYNNATFNRQIRAGMFNPHLFPSGTQYRQQLHYYPSVVTQANAASRNINNSTANGSPPPPQSDTILTMDMTTEDFNDDSCHFLPPTDQ